MSGRCCCSLLWFPIGKVGRAGRGSRRVHRAPCGVGSWTIAPFNAKGRVFVGIRGDGGRPHHQDGDESAEQGLASAAGVVHELEEAEFAMFVDLGRRYRWVLPTHHYDDPERLIADLGERAIRPAETKVLELRGLQQG